MIPPKWKRILPYERVQGAAFYKKMKKVISLNGAWQIRWNDGERGERIARVLAGDLKWNRAWPANVPGSVHESLRTLAGHP
jgi:hypothetical protein